VRTRRCHPSISRITTPPTTSATATVTGLNSFSSMKSFARNPTMAAGRKAMTRFRISRCDLRLPGAVRTTSTIFARYSHTTARMAPSWMNTSKVFAPCHASKPRNRPAMIRCPVEDTGMNSVAPSTSPITAALANRIGSTAPVRSLRKSFQVNRRRPPRVWACPSAALRAGLRAR